MSEGVDARERRVPTIRVELELGGPVGLGVVDSEPGDAERILEWLRADPLGRLIAASALALGQPRKGDLSAGDEELAALAEGGARACSTRQATSGEDGSGG